jgi:hypothetical protein
MSPDFLCPWFLPHSSHADAGEKREIHARKAGESEKAKLIEGGY